MGYITGHRWIKVGSYSNRSQSSWAWLGKFFLPPGKSHMVCSGKSMGDLQDPKIKMEVLYHMFGHILWGYSLKHRPKK